MENKTAKILAIDDNQDNLIILKALIKDSFPNVAVITSLSGPEGLAMTAAEDPDVILLDILMPGMDGFEVCRHLKADPQSKEIPVVFVTALKDEKENRIRALESGGDAFLAKPIDQSELIAQISAMMKIRMANKQKQNEKERLAALVSEKTHELNKAHLETLKVLEDLKAENKARRESEEKYRRIAENITDVVWTSDLNLAAGYVSPSIQRLYGEPAEIYTARPFEERFTPNSLALIRSVLAEELEKDKDPMVSKFRTRVFEVEHYKADGSIIWVSMHVSFVRDENGKAIGLQGVSRDITQRKLAEKALLNSELRYRRLFETAQTGIMILEANTGIIKNVNPFLVDMLGYPAEHYINNPPWSIEPFKRHVKDRDMYFRLRKPGNLRNENIVFATAGGRNIDVELVCNEYTVDGQIEFQCHFRNITDRKQAEKALIHSHDMLRYIIEHNRSAVAVYDKDLRYLYVSQRYLDDYHLQEDIIGKHCNEVVQDMPYILREAHDKALKGEVVSADEANYLQADGTLVWIRWECRPWFEADGSIGGILLYVENITERKQSEIELKKTKENLEQLIANANAPIAVWDESLTITRLNSAFQELVGRKEEEIIGKSISLFLPSSKLENVLGRLKILAADKSSKTTEFDIMHNDGSVRTVLWSLATIQESGEASRTSTIAQGQDITDRIAAEKRLTYLSYHDQLTGIYNRRFFEDEITRLDISINLPLTIVVGDINGLKMINDSFGHSVGDELLQKAADIIQRACRRDDIIARLGGDEFVIAFPCTGPQEAVHIIDRIEHIASGVKVANVDLSISFGYDTKVSQQQSLTETLANAENQMYKNKLHERSSLRSNIISIIMNALFEKSNRESQHSQRVSRICQDIAYAMHFEKDYVKQIGIAGLVHDIGKIGIDEKILNKPGRLNEEERKEIERHPETGWRILSSSSEFSDLAQYVLEHHERWDGSGYPRSLSGKSISIEARIIAIADSYDAMTTERSYRKGMSREEAVLELKRCSGTQFDPDIVTIFVNEVLPKFEQNI